MMINKRLIGTVSESKKYVAANVALRTGAGTPSTFGGRRTHETHLGPA